MKDTGANDTKDFEWQLAIGCEHLRAHDAILAPLIKLSGLPTFAPHRNYYQALVSSIISQQLSVKAAATINGRFIDLFHHFPTPEDILAKDFEELRSVGLSGQKTTYIRDLAARVSDGSVKFEHLDSLPNNQIITELTAVKGIGEWTVHMFLMFCMGRLDVLAFGDLGIRNAITKLYGFDSVCSADDIRAVALKYNWHPYESIACWYAWRSLENVPYEESGRSN